MAKERVKVTTPADIDASREAEELAELNFEEGGELFRAIEEARSAEGVTVMVTRTLPVERKGFCDKIPVAEFDLMQIKRRFGAGTYRLRFLGPKGLIPGGGTISIAPPSEDAPRATAGGDFMSYMEFVQKQEEARREKTGRLLELGIPALGTLLAAIFNRPHGPDVAQLIAALKPAPGPSLTDLTAAMVNLKTLNAPAAAGSDPVDTVLKVFEAARDLGGGDSGGKGSATNWLDVVKELIGQAGPVAAPLLQGLAARAQAARAGAGAATPTIVNPAPPRVIAPAPAIGSTAAPSAAPAAPASAGSAAAPLNGNGEDAGMWALVKPLMLQKLKLISQWASEGKNPEIYADLFLNEHVPANLQNYLPPQKALEYLQDARWFEVVCEWEPALKPYQSWCEIFRDQLIYWVSEAVRDDAHAANGADAPPDDGEVFTGADS